MPRPLPSGRVWPYLARSLHSSIRRRRSKEQFAQLQVAGVTGGGVAVITPATAPSAPSSPKPAHDAFLGLILGFLLGIGLALLVEQLDGTVHRKDEVERLTLGAHVLASVPVVRSRRNRPFIVTMTKPNSMAGEAYRSLRTSLHSPPSTLRHG